MNGDDAFVLNRLNADFYRRSAPSFSATRQHPWPGWDRVLHAVGAPHDVLDLACGNLRFERHVAATFPQAATRFHCVDACEELVLGASGPAVPGVRLQVLDIVAQALAGSLSPAIEASACDLAVSFGFLHHVPGASARAEVLCALAEHAAPGGYVAVSFWRFADDPRLAAKARRTTAEALATREELADVQLEDGDYLVGWSNVPGLYRYCHGFSSAEVDGLSAQACDACGMQVAARFRADGRTGTMNEYVLFRKNVL